MNERLHTHSASNHDLLNASFMEACRDYAYLINRLYPERGAVKLVGDRYRLTRDQRTVLYRGISSREKSEIRKSRLVKEIKGLTLAVDGYNVLFSLLNYRLGRFTFIANDNFLRDAGSLHGRLREEKTFQGCLSQVMNFLVSQQPARVDVFLDSPVSHSERHAQMIREMLASCRLLGECHVLHSADFALKHYQYDVLATSDTVIIEKAERPVTDIPRMILEKHYHADLVRIADLLLSPGTDQAEDAVNKG